jgi:HK97 family phage major capsid protein
MAKRKQPEAAAAATATEEAIPVQYAGEVEIELVRRLRAADGTLLPEDTEEAGDDVEEVFDIVISTETPVPVPGGFLVLSHEAGAVDLSLAKRGLSFLLEHGGAQAPYKVDPTMHVGVVENVRVENRQTRGEVRFGSSEIAEQVRDDFKNKIRRFISAGWLPAPGQRAELRSRGKNGEPDTYVMKKWQLCEASSVSVPADVNARVGFSAGGASFPVGDPGDQPAQEEASMKRVAGEGGAVIEVADDDPRTAVPIETRSGAGSTSSAVDLTARNKEIGDIVNVCVLNGLQARAGEWVEQGLSLEQVKSRILDVRSTAGTLGTTGQPGAERMVDLSNKDAKDYNIVRAIRCAMALAGDRSFKADGLEMEVSREIELRANREGIQTRGGVFLPTRLQEIRPEVYDAMQARIQTRAVTMGPNVALGGAELVNSTMGEFIDLLRNSMQTVALGARTIPGVVGVINWPRLTQDPTVQWMSTNPGTPAADSGAKFGFVTSSPKTMIGTVPFPRQLINLTNLDVQALLSRTLTIGHALALDLAGVKGLGTDGQPLGVVNNPDVQSLGMGSTVPTYKLLRQGVGQVLKKNIPGDLLGYMTTPEMAAVLSATLKASNVPGFIWDGRLEDGNIGGYRSVTTNQAPITSGTDHALILGAWANLVYALWGALEIIVDPLTLSTSGQIRITTFQMGDVVNQRPEGFLLHTAARLS